MNDQNQASTPTTREYQLELQIWMERGRALQTKGELLQAQAALLNAEMNGCKENVARLQAILQPRVTEKVEQVEAGGAAPPVAVPVSDESAQAAA